MRKKLLLLVLIGCITLFSYQITHALFSDTAVSSNNTFTASDTFPGPIGTVTPTPTVTPTSTPTPTLTPTPPQNIANHVVISEVQIDGGTGDLNKNDFIELYNPTNTSKSLNGLRLVKRTGSSTNDDTIYSFQSAHNIQPYGFFLWAHYSGSNHFAESINADASSSATIAGNNSIALKNISTEETIDALSWDVSSNSLKEGTEFSPDPGINQSMERKALSSSTATSMTTGADVGKGNGYDAGDNATDFILRPTSQPQNSSSGTETL